MPPALENLRSGYTTGACAAAATRGALLALVYQRHFSEAAIRLPQGQLVTFALQSCSYSATQGRSSVIKDAGDDPDVTDKAEICALVEWSSEAGVRFRRGTGVGLVTKVGLPVPLGEPAINPAPRSMIREAVQEVLAEAERTGHYIPAQHPGVMVEISVPNGEELARKTFNPRLGIVGGISILGTSGIVVPYSNAAWVASVTQAIDVAVAQNCRHLVLTVGGRSERAAQERYQLPEVAFVQIGPFFGDALRHCGKVGVVRVSLFAMIGKLAKFAAGNASVHSTVSSQDFDVLAQIAMSAGGDAPLGARIVAANTAQEVAEIIRALGLHGFFDLLCEKAWHFAQTLCGAQCTVEIVLAGIQGEILGRFPPRVDCG
jgi:cobalt-precorrin-5B (C1)-methyltransferase